MIVEEENKLFRKVELSVEDIEAEIKVKEDSMVEVLAEIEYLKGFLPVEEEESEEIDGQNTPNF